MNQDVPQKFRICMFCKHFKGARGYEIVNHCVNPDHMQQVPIPGFRHLDGAVEPPTAWPEVGQRNTCNAFSLNDAFRPLPKPNVEENPGS